MIPRNFALAFVAVAVCSIVGRAQSVLVSQHRRIDLSVQAYDPNGTPPPTTLAVAAPDAAPFLSQQSLQVSSAVASASATATHASTIAPDRITGSGSGTANVTGGGIGSGSFASANSDTAMYVTFDVPVPTPYSIVGSLTRSDGTGGQADPSAILSGPGGTFVFYFSVSAQSGTVPVQQAGLLAPGRYTFSAWCTQVASTSEFWHVNGSSSFQVDLRLGSGSGTPFCFGDGSGTACPCGNSSPVGDESGCRHSFGAGGKLRGLGTPSLSNDTFVLLGTQMSNGTALFFQGTTQEAGGNGAVFGDGKRCASGSIRRLGTRATAFGASEYPSGSDPSISVRGAIASPGTRTYQAWYRNNASFCSAATFNLTNGLQVTWTQ